MYFITNRQPTSRQDGWTYFRTKDDSVTMWEINDLSALAPKQMKRVVNVDRQLDVIAEQAVRQAMKEAPAPGEATPQPTDPDYLSKFRHLPMVLAFVHGYNNTVEDSVGITEKIREGLSKHKISPVMVALSWPADGKLTNYLQDRDDADGSALAIINTLGAVRKNRALVDCRVNIVIVAHSMGNRVIREGLRKYAQQLGYPDNLPVFSEIVSVAADIDADSLSGSQTGIGMISLSRRITTYYNRYDSVLTLSKDLKSGGSNRLGRSGPVFNGLARNVVGVDCSDCIRPPSNVELISQIQGLTQIHSAYFDNSVFYKDLAYTVCGIDRDVIPTRKPRVEGPIGRDYVLKKEDN